jgi:hypothetical protein
MENVTMRLNEAIKKYDDLHYLAQIAGEPLTWARIMELIASGELSARNGNDDVDDIVRAAFARAADGFLAELGFALDGVQGVGTTRDVAERIGEAADWAEENLAEATA